jgi:hypothetical protein
MAWTSQRSGSWARTSNNADSPWYDAGTQTAAASAPPDDTAITLAAGHAVLMDYDSSGLANGYQTVTITGNSAGNTPACLYWADGSSGYLLMKTGCNIVGTNVAVRGQLLANSDGVWGNIGALPFDHKAVILLTGTAKIDALYLDIAMRATHPTNWYVETYKTAYVCTDQTASVNTTTGVITFTGAPPSAGTAVRVKSSGTLPTGLSADEIYYTRTVSGNTCKLALLNADAHIQIATATGSGTLTMYSGHTDTGTATVNVVQNVTADAPWVTTDGHDRTVLYNYRFALNTINAASIVLSANVNAAQDPCARLYLSARNVSIRSAGTTAAQPIVDYGAGTHAGVFDCEIVGTGGTGSTVYGHGVSAGAGHTISGVITGCSFGVNTGSGHTISGTLIGGARGVVQGLSHAISGTITGFSIAGLSEGSLHTITGNIFSSPLGMHLGNGHTFSGLIRACPTAVNQCTGCVCTGTITGSTSAAMSNGANNTLTGRISGCEIGINAGTNHYSEAAIIGCTTGVAVAVNTGGGGMQIGNSISYCVTGLSGGQGTLNGCNLHHNTQDITLVGGDWSGIGTTLGSTPQVASYKYGAAGYTHKSRVQILDFGGYDEDLAVWTPGGMIKTNAGHTAHVLTAQDNRADVWMRIPFRAVSGQQVTVTVTDATLSAHTAWTDLPVFAIVDPTQPWKGASEYLDSETQAHDASAHTYTLTYTPDHDCELWFMVRAKGGDASGTGTETLTFTFDISPGGTGAAATTRAWASMG